MADWTEVGPVLFSFLLVSNQFIEQMKKKKKLFKKENYLRLLIQSQSKSVLFFRPQNFWRF